MLFVSAESSAKSGGQEQRPASKKAIPPAGSSSATPQNSAAQAGESSLRASNESRIVAPGPMYRFPNGQTLSYRVEWRLFDAGTATIRMEAAGPKQRIVSTADATGAVGLLYHVQDRFETIVEPKTFCALSLHKHTEEGFRRLDTNVTFDEARQKSILSETNLRNNESKRVENETPGCVEDVLSAIYYVASLPLAPGTVHHIPLNDGGKTTEVKVTVEAREDVKTPAGTFKTVRVQPTAESGLIKNRGQIWVWYSDDAAHIPVQMKARLFWGTLAFELQKIDSQSSR